MTVASTTNKQSYNGNGSQSVFAYTFKIFVDADIKVYVGTTLKTLNTHYTLSGVGTTSGGNVTFTSGNFPVSGTGNVTILRSLALTQGLDLVNYGRFDAEVVEAQYDKIVMMVQQLQEQADRTIRFSTTVSDAGGVEITDTVAERSNKVLAYDANGDLSATNELGNWQGNWSTTTAYAVRDLVLDSATNNVYTCLVGHTAGTLTTDVSANKWALVINAAAIAASATTATTKASEASTSASTASTHATTATIKASEAASSASTASTQASTAITKASEASTSATASANTATASASSAGAAASSAASLNVDAISATITATPVDLFIYDTSKDSDGGEWRHRTQGTSWYNETLNTATRGSRKKFPAVAVLVAEASKVTIYDGDDPAMPMWMVLNFVGYGMISGSMNGVTAINGLFSLGGGANAISFVDFIKDRGTYLTSTLWNNVLGNIADRHVAKSGLGSQYSTQRLVNSIVNDIAMTVLPNAPVDSATGLPIPTIAVATDGGVSVIKNNETIVDITNGTTPVVAFVSFTDNDRILAGVDAGGVWAKWIQIFDIPNGDVAYGFAVAPNNIYDSYEGADINRLMLTPSSSLVNSLISGGGLVNAGANQGLGIGTLNPVEVGVQNSNMVTHITSDYNTGYMVGDIKLATLSDTSTIISSTEADRSVNQNPLTVNGPITKSAVVTGAALVAYSGVSTGYLEQPYNSDLDFGTGDFSVTCWIKIDSVNAAWSHIVEKSWNESYLALRIHPTSATLGGTILFHIGNSSWALTGYSPVGKGWVNICLVRSSGESTLYANGVSVYTTASHTGSVTNPANPPIYIRPTGCALANLRISATAPTAAQIKTIYEAEKPLYQENAQATLYGSSDAVTALAHDSDTNLLHVGTSSGRSVFQGLRRVDNTTTAVNAAISASNGLVVED